MSEQFATERHGHRVEVESDESLVVVSRVRLFIDGSLADERSALWEVRLRGGLPGDGGHVIPVKVEVSYGMLGGVEKCVLVEDGIEYPMGEEKREPRKASRKLDRPDPAPPKPDKESELLRAMKENGGRVSAVKVATETSLTVKEADAMLSEFASEGHLFVEPSGGSLVYSLPGNEPEEG